MKRNKILIVILVLLLVITIGVVMLYQKNNNEQKNSFVDDKEINYYNEESSYYDYYDNGIITLNINDFVKLPENYLEYKISGNTEEELRQKVNENLYLIIQNSEVKVPNSLLNGYYGDLYTNIKNVAENENKAINEYIEELYQESSYQEFAENNHEVNEEQIKRDLVYQALMKEFNITVGQSDIEEYFSERIKNEGYTYKDLKDMYGEELLYKYTLENKVEQELLKRFSK